MTGEREREREKERKRERERERERERASGGAESCYHTGRSYMFNSFDAVM